MPKTILLVDVYHGIREILWDEFEEDSDEDIVDAG